MTASGGQLRHRLLYLSPVAASVAFNAVVLRPELRSVQTQNDFGMHLSMVRWASERIGAGHLPLDGWYPYLGLGSPQFSQYPTLAHVVIGAVARVLDAAAAMRWSEYVLLVTWPVAVYVGARLIGLDRWAAGGTAIAAPFLMSVTNYGLELPSYAWRGYGIWPQVWAQWTLPLAWGLSHRAIQRRGSTWLAALAVGVTFALHFVTGYVCVVGVGAIALAGAMSASHLRAAAARIGRAGLVVGGGMLAISYVLVPLLQQRRWASFAGLDRPSVQEAASSYGPAKAIGWFFSGELYDNGRLPVVTGLVMLGLAVCVVRRKEVHGAVLGLWVMTFAVFAAGSSLDVAGTLLPGSSDLFTRFIIGVHLSGVFAAGIGAGWLAELLLVRVTAALSPPEEVGAPVYRVLAGCVLAIAAAVALFPAWSWSWRFERQGEIAISEQQRQDATDGAALDTLLAQVASAGGGRVFAGSAATSGSSYRIGRVPVFMWLNNHDVDAVGYSNRVASLSTQVEINFIDIVPGDYPLFGVRYVLTPSDRQPAPGLAVRRVATAGRHALWEVTTTSGYIGVVDTEGTIKADRKSLADRVLRFVASVPPVPQRHPTLALAGEPAAPATDPAGTATGAPGSVDVEIASPADGRFVATVTANRTAAVVLRTSYSGKWSVRVDGRPSRAYPVAPSFVAVTVPSGRHDVVFAYQPYGHYLALWALGVATLASLALYDRRSKQLRLLSS